jgi:uncharacterized protein with HEPN domain
MSRRDDSVPMRHMLDYAREGVAFVRGKSRADLDHDRMLQLGFTRIVEIVGEAARRVSKGTQACYPGIAWQDAISTRNRVIHGYDLVDYDIVWQILTVEFPRLIEALEEIFPGHQS